MISICGESILKLLKLKFKSYTESGTFLTKCEKTNVVPEHKK